MITSVSVENFKGIGQRVTIPLKPITLLFGPNSAGKSTILHAIHFSREIFERHNLDADTTLAGGEFVDLGGFRNFVHNHQADAPVTFRFDLDLSKSNTSLPELEAWDEVQTRESAILSAIDDVKTAWVEVTVRFNATQYLRPGAYVASYAVGIDGHELATLVSTPERNSVRLLDLNRDHPIFKDKDAEPEAPGLFDDVMFIVEPGPDGPDMLVLNEQSDALPEWGRTLQLDLTMDVEDNPEFGKTGNAKKYSYETDMRKLILSRLLVGPGQLLRDFLMRSRYVGPLREVPPRNFEPPRSPGPSRWAGGLAAWDFLLGADEPFITKLNAWLSYETKLNIGYTIRQRRAFLADDVLLRTIKANEAFELEGEYLESLLLSGSAPRVFLVDEAGQQLQPHDVGMGISQVLPVVVAILASGSNFVAIEQPELHVHPRVQVALGDLLIEEACGNNLTGRQFVIETHSEHLLLRLLRRIRETTEQRLPPGAMALKAEQITVLYVGKAQSGTTLTQLRVNESGEFIDAWPQGFFEERGEELFG